MNPKLPKSYRVSMTTLGVGLALLLYTIFLNRDSTIPDGEFKKIVSWIMTHAGWALVAFSAIYTRLMYTRYPDFRQYYKKHVFEHFSIGTVEPQDEREQLMKYQAGYETYAIMTAIIVLLFVAGYIFQEIHFTWHYFAVISFVTSMVYYWKLFRKGVEIRNPKDKK